MPSEINEAGYQDYRKVVNSSEALPDQWDYIELRDGSGNPITRVSITGDSRAQWTTTASEQVQQVEIEITGSDSDIDISSGAITIEGSALFTVASGGIARHEDTMTPATIANDTDQVIVRHNLEVPQV